MAAVDNCKSIILFGRTGSGKSTLGNYLLFGNDPQAHVAGFGVGDGARGITSSCTVKHGRNWLVTDTVGFGETNQGTVTSLMAEKKLYNFLGELKHRYLYIVYVVKQGRMQDGDVVTWELFKKIFEGGETNFVVVFTSSSQRWLNENMAEIKKHYVGCAKFLAVDFPPISDDSGREALNRRDRGNSLQHFERTLSGYGFEPVFPIVSHMNPQELMQHVKVIIEKLIAYAVQRFIINADNPFAWLMKTLGGFF